MELKESFLILKDGLQFSGKSPAWQTGAFIGEVVFTTGMCGYMESLTDPSFSGQILLFTYPLIGNYGISSSEVWESKKAHVAGVIVSESCARWSHHSGLLSLQEWLKKESIPLITEVDTRALTKILRARGTTMGAITDLMREIEFGQMEPDLIKKVSPSTKTFHGKGKRVIAVDCGMKENLFRFLARYPIEIVRVPYDYDYSEEAFDGVFLSNGPGDPLNCQSTIEILQRAMKKKRPIFGVCLGSQMMALAAGAKTYKLPFGHRGQNQPCIDEKTKRCYITSQNHGYAVDESSLPSDWCVTFRNLNDQSVEGIAHQTLPFYSVQFHPEAAPGPTDTHWLFEKFWECLR